jgi:hypothetical protein
LDTFWLSVKEEYLVISEMAVRILLPFSTMYLCELGFSTLMEIKTSKREQLRTTAEEMRVALSAISPLSVSFAQQSRHKYHTEAANKVWNVWLSNIIICMQDKYKTYFLEFVVEIHY